MEGKSFAENYMEHKIPKEIKKTLDVLNQAGFSAHLVGGCVRDLLLDPPKTPKDWDIATDAKPEEIQALFANTFYENQFGTVGVVTESKDPKSKIIEITPYRLEAKYTDKRHPDSVSFAATLEDDLKRRDFSINALAMGIETRNKEQKTSRSQELMSHVSCRLSLIDLFNGQQDIKNKIIRAVGNAEDRFDEDALRIMRAIRFMCELGFDIEEKTEKALEEKKELLEIISKERIRDELVKIIMSNNPDKGFEKMRGLGILRYVLPEIEEGFGVTQNKHHIYTVWEHNLKALAHAANKKWPLAIRLSSLLHDVGKPRAKKGEGPDSTFYSHEVIGAKMTAGILRRLRFPKKFGEKVVKLVRWHLFFSDTEKITLSAVRRIIRNVGPENIWDLMKLRFTDRVGMGRPKEEPFRLRKYEAMVEQALRDPISVSMLEINGDDIMKITRLQPCPKIGYILNALLEKVLDDPSFNNKEWLENEVKKLAVLPDQELEKLGKEGKYKRESLEEREVEKIMQKYRVR